MTEKFKSDEEISNLKGLVADLRINVDLAEVAMMEVRDKQKEAEQVAREVKEKAVIADKKAIAAETRAQKAASQVLSKYKTSQAYVDDLANGSSTAYRVGFRGCKDTIAGMNLRINLS
ncbi:hypothetical protein COCNU_02G017160 [Cocos nucifera]|uniref:Uncharacterized protein n=1 Tax=Cocos nucifera TaxID=13894 RepID=A0A8K0I0M1_COCNU|nr:hypothetical protein COCNU_02G017160 [Cocos nucifera]